MNDGDGVPVALTTAPDFVQVRLALMRYLGGALEAVVFTRIQYRTRQDSRAWVEHAGRRWWTVAVADLAEEMGATEKQIRRVLDLLTARGALAREHLNERGPYDRRWSYSPVITDVPSGANEVPSRADVHAPSGANDDSPSGADLPIPQELEEGREKQTPPLSPFCSAHPTGTPQPCGPCGTARLSYEQQKIKSDSTPKPAYVSRLSDTAMCSEHLGYVIEVDGSCARCERDRAERAALAAEQGVAV